MLRTNHTKGNWQIKEHTPNTYKITVEGKISEIARVYTDIRGNKQLSISYKEALSNAKLMATAPELLEKANIALQVLLTLKENYDLPEMGIIEGLKKVIEKATI